MPDKAKPTHNMIELTVQRADTDPLLCPVMTTTMITGLQQSPITKEVTGINTSSVIVACAGPVCAVYDRNRKKCSFNTETTPGVM